MTCYALRNHLHLYLDQHFEKCREKGLPSSAGPWIPLSSTDTPWSLFLWYSDMCSFCAAPEQIMRKSCQCDALPCRVPREGWTGYPRLMYPLRNKLVTPINKTLKGTQINHRGFMCWLFLCNTPWEAVVLNTHTQISENLFPTLGPAELLWPPAAQPVLQGGAGSAAIIFIFKWP